MRLPVSALLSLPEAVRFVGEATSENENHVRTALREAGLAGAITATGCSHLSTHLDPARYFAHPALNDREPVPPDEWGTTISWVESRIARYDLVRLNRADIERWLAAQPMGTNEPREESSQLRTETGNSRSKTRSRPKREPAKKLLRGMFPGTFPTKYELPDRKLFRKCKGPEWDGISPDTISRAAEELRKG